jgi:hypothetical protein
MRAETHQAVAVEGLQRRACGIIEAVLPLGGLGVLRVARPRGAVGFQREEEAIERVGGGGREEVVGVAHTGQATTALPWCQEGS